MFGQIAARFSLWISYELGKGDKFFKHQSRLFLKIINISIYSPVLWIY